MKTIRFEIVENTASKDNMRWLVCYFGIASLTKPPLKKILSKINPDTFKKLRNKSFTKDFIFNNKALVELLKVQKITLSEEEKDNLLSSIKLTKENFGFIPKIDDDILDDVISDDLLEPIEIPKITENLEGNDEDFDSFFQEEFGVDLNQEEKFDENFE